MKCLKFNELKDNVKNEIIKFYNENMNIKHLIQDSYLNINKYQLNKSIKDNNVKLITENTIKIEKSINVCDKEKDSNKKIKDDLMIPSFLKKKANK